MCVRGGVPDSARDFSPRPRRLPPNLPAILVSAQLAEREHLRAGDVVTLATSADGSGQRPFRVDGIYEPTADPVRFTARRLEARMHLPDLVAMTADPAIRPQRSRSPPSMCGWRIPATPRDLPLPSPPRAGIAVRPTVRARDGSDPFAVLERFHVAVAIVTVLGSTAFLLALMVMRAEERRETIGIIRLIGVSQRTTCWKCWSKDCLIAAAGAVFGILLAIATQGAVKSILSMALRHRAVFRAGDAIDRAAVDRRLGAARYSGGARGLLDPAAPRRPRAARTMTAWGLAWRTIARSPARSMLAVAGVTVIGALLFNMLLLSRGCWSRSAI